MKQALQGMLLQLLRQTNADRLGIVRNTFLAASALCTAILVALTQVGAKELSLQITVIGCSIAAPIWLCLAAVIEIHLHMGEATFPHLHGLRAGKAYAALQAIAGAGMYAALCGIVYFLFPLALAAFVVASILSVAFVIIIYVRIAKWWAAQSIAR